MAFPTIDRGPVTINAGERASFELNPVNPAGISKRPTWISSSFGVKPEQAADGMTCDAVPEAGFTGVADILCDVWFNDGNQERQWWQLTVVANPAVVPNTKLAPSVTKRPKF